MTLEQINQAIDNGKQVNFGLGYNVIKRSNGDLYVKCYNGHMIGIENFNLESATVKD